jgi:hypothetical protein
MSNDITIVPKPAPRLIASFADLAPVTILAEITMPDDDVLLVPMRELRYSEFARLGLEVPAPTPPMMGIDPTTKRPLYDYSNPDYQRQLTEANIRRGYRRLIEMIDIPIPGDTVDEKIDNLDKLTSHGVVKQLLDVVNELADKAEGRISAKAATFHPDPRPPAESQPSAPHDDGSVSDDLAA